jgi:hypothetical protein
MLLSGCNSGTPKCNSDDARNLVISIAREQAAKEFAAMKNSQLSGMYPKNIDSVKFSVKNVRTTKHQSSPDIYECAADLEMSGVGAPSIFPITYNIQKTDDGSQFYINVLGL